MRYAETGVNLEIDLTRGNIERVQTDPKDTELYLGGLGTSTKILWDRVPSISNMVPVMLRLPQKSLSGVLGGNIIFDVPVIVDCGMSMVMLILFSGRFS